MPDKKESSVNNCTAGGCKGPHECKGCGFDRKEAERRKRLPLYLCTDGLARMFIVRKAEKPKPVEELPG